MKVFSWFGQWRTWGQLVRHVVNTVSHEILEPSEDEKREAAGLYLKTFDTSNFRNPERVWQECRLKCGHKHPFGILCFCEMLMFKTAPESRAICRTPAVKACTRCLQPEASMRRKHNSQSCPFRSYKCAICKFLKKDDKIAETHLSLMCNELIKDRSLFKKVMMLNDHDQFRANKLLRFSEDQGWNKSPLSQMRNCWKHMIFWV